MRAIYWHGPAVPWLVVRRILTLGVVATAVLVLGANSCETDGDVGSDLGGTVVEGTPCDEPTRNSIGTVVRALENLPGPPADLEPVDCRVSPSDPSWAAITVSFPDADPNVAILKRAPGTDAGWEVLTLGTAAAGCLEAPGAVRAELGLDCPAP